VATIPVPLARHALRVFDDDLTHLIPLIHHPGFSAATFKQIWKDANDTWKKYEHESRRGSIAIALATNSSLPKDLLRILRNEAVGLKRSQDERLLFLVSRHSSADHPSLFGLPVVGKMRHDRLFT